MAVSQHIILEKPKGMNFFIFLFDKWAMIGFTGFILNIFSLFKGAELPDITGLSGLVIVAVAIYQKIRDDRRKQQKHDKQLQIIESMRKKEIPINEKVLIEFMETPQK